VLLSIAKSGIVKSGILTQTMHKTIRQTSLKTWVVATIAKLRNSNYLLGGLRVMYLNGEFKYCGI
jgi:hypothetical protein